ncbi:MAG: hypothetical protein UX62_C0003G0022 [Microgenomates group bacterium GW2011_GWA2_46_7]|nr:MAG: hypothetical protein UX64_C0015G0003 [Microgenomates group bacterium GW2011_GWC2_46_7]KKU46924.1 MAG: hypothetical protein UX62_C0003G0022 [Microgenomates group bacterium GW2011_GWA2_46_7]
MKTPKLTFNISETAEILVPDKLGRTSYFVGLMIGVIMTILITILISRLPAVVPMYFTLPWGEARLTSRVMLYLLPALALLILMVNLSLGRVASKLSLLLPRVLAVGTAITAGMLLLALVGIVQSLTL